MLQKKGGMALLNTGAPFLAELVNEWRLPGGRMDLIVGACALLLGAFAFVAMAAAGWLNFTRQPLFDSWDLWLVRLNEHSLWSFLLTPHNSHFIPIPRLLYLADEKLFRGEAWMLLWLTFIVQLGTALILYRLTGPRAGSIALKATLFGLILAFVFAAPQWINYTSALQVCFVLPVSTAIAAFAALTKSARADEPRRATLWFALSLMLALFSVGTSANGLPAWPLLVVLAMLLRLPVRRVAILTLLTLALAALYVTLYQPPVSRPRSSLVAHLPAMVVFALAYVGSAIDEPFVWIGGAMHVNVEPYRIAVAAAVGGLGIAWFVQVAIRDFRSGQRSPERATLLIISTYCLASAVLTAFGRSELSVLAALTSRYTTPSVLFWISMIGLTLVPDRGAPTSSRRGALKRVAALAAGILVGGILQPSKVAYGAASGSYLVEGEDAFINGAFEPSLWERTTYSAGRIIPVVNHLRHEHLGPFSYPWAPWVGDSALNHFELLSSKSCIGGWEDRIGLGNTFRPTVLAAGWAYDRQTGQPPHLLVFVDTTYRILGFARPTRFRPDVVKVVPEINPDKKIGWRVYLPVSEATDATAFMVSEDERDMCPIMSVRLPGTYVTAPAATADDEISGAAVASLDAWVSSLPDGLAPPPFGGAVYSSHTLATDSSSLRVGPITVRGGQTIGLPIVTGPAATDVHLSAIDRVTNETIATATPPPGRTQWDLWRIDIPAGLATLTLDYVVERQHRRPGDWVIVGAPRYLRAGGQP